MEQISIAIELRALAVVIGFAALLHFAFMANFLAGQKAHVLVAILTLAAMSSGVMGLFAYLNDCQVVIISAIVLCCSMFLMLFWLWLKGFTVCDFVDKLGNNNA